jgi:hypothetical protein
MLFTNHSFTHCNSSIDIETELTNIYGWSPIKNGELRAPITLQSNDNLIHALVNPPYEKYTYGQNLFY